MARKTYTYEATIRIKVSGVENAAQAREVARMTMLDVRAVALDGLEGRATVHGGSPKPRNNGRQTAAR